MTDETPKDPDMTPVERHVWCYLFLRMAVHEATKPNIGNVVHFSEAAADQVIRKLRERGMVDDAYDAITQRDIVNQSEALSVDVHY